MTFGTTPITAGAGTDIAVDDVSSDLFQRMKLADGTAGGTDGIPGSATKGLAVEPRVTVTRVRVAAVVSTTPAYTAGDAVGGELAFASAVRSAGQTGTLRRVQVTDKGQQNAELEVHFFDRSASGSTFTDNAALDIAAADLPYYLGTVNIAAADWANFSATAVADIAVALPIKPNATTLYAYMVVRSTPTFVSTSDLAVTVLVEQD